MAFAAISVFILNHWACSNKNLLAADLCIFFNSPPINILYSGLIKSVWPLQLDTIVGLPVIACSSRGLPNPSPLVKEMNDFTFGSLLILFNSSLVNSPCKR